MVCCKDRPFLCPVLFFGILAVALHGVAYVAPGWIMLGREVTKLNFRELFRVDEVDVREFKEPPQAPENPVAMAKRAANDMLTTAAPAPAIEEVVEFKTWAMAIVDISDVNVRVNYGLWYSTVCLHEKYVGSQTVVVETDTIMMEKKEVEKRSSSKDDSSSDEDDKMDKKHKKCHCKKISTYCALQLTWLFRDRQDPEWYLSTRHFGYASLNEHRIENSVALFFLAVGLISAVGAFRKNKGCRCAAIVCVIAMLVAALLIIVPVVRFGRFSRHKNDQDVPVYVHWPASVLCAGVSALLAVLVALIAAAGAMCKRKERAGRWYQFNNEQELPDEKSAKPQLVFISADPLPEKVPLE